jgi:hypothetical protein
MFGISRVPDAVQRVARSPDERSDIRGCLPAYRGAHAGYLLRSIMPLGAARCIAPGKRRYLHAMPASSRTCGGRFPASVARMCATTSMVHLSPACREACHRARVRATRWLMRATCRRQSGNLPAVDRSKTFAGSSACAAAKVEQQFAASARKQRQMTLAEIEQAKHVHHCSIHSPQIWPRQVLSLP